MLVALLKMARVLVPLLWAVSAILTSVVAFASGGIFTTNSKGIVVDQNQYASSTDVFVSGGPQNTAAAGLSDGTYYFQVTDPSGSKLLSTDNAECRQVKVVGGRVAGATGPCPHPNGSFNAANGTTPVQLAPFSTTPNAGGEYKAWLIAQNASTSISTADPRLLTFKQSDASTDNFKVQQSTVVVPTGSCEASSSLSVLVQGSAVTAYVPKGNWSSTLVTGVSAINIEGTSITPTRIATPNVVNSVASNPITGQSVAVANNADVYLLNGTTLTQSLTSGGNGFISFSGGSCTNCGVSMDAVHNRALIGMSVGGAPGFQILDLGATPSFEPAFVSRAGAISEDPLIDPVRNFLLSASERNNYEIVNLTTSTSPAFFENPIAATGDLDSSAEDCATGIALAPAEFSAPSQVYVADLKQATFTAGSPGTWTAPSQVQTLSESVLAAGASGISVAQGTDTAVITGEFGGNALTAAALPTTSGSGTPAISDWVSCSIPGFSNGFDPHTVTAYESPNSSHAIAVLANGGATSVAVVDLTNMLDRTIVARTAGGHGCAAGTLPSSVVTMISVP